jgi:chorismate synthase
MSIRFLTAGESHGPALTVILDGLPAGLPLAPDVINHELQRRQSGVGSGPRMKKEQDTAHILGGIMAGVTTGAPIAIVIENLDHVNWRGKKLSKLTIPRPGHADLNGALKYGYDDLRISMERASARETAARVSAGAICKHFLRQFDITVRGYVESIGDIQGDLEAIPLEDRFALAETNPVHCPDQQAARKMVKVIEQTMKLGDSLGGVIEVIAQGLPPGLGSFVHWDRRLDGRLGAALLSIPAIKGVEIGRAFDQAHLTSTQVQDAIQIEGDQLSRPTNHCGGLEGGITTGQPLILRAPMKPIPSTIIPQQSVDLASGKAASTQYERSDFCPVPRAIPILEAMAAFILADALIEKLGGDSLEEMLARHRDLRNGRLSDLRIERDAKVYWPEESTEKINER